MSAPHSVLATIGYELASIDDFVATLVASGVRRLLDIRELPISRRKGFAKRALSAALAQADIEYIHLRGLGDPKPGRDAARAGDLAGFRRIFAEHLRSEPAQSALQQARHLVERGGVCLMCYERDHTTCHRSIVATEISATVPTVVRHLGVRNGFAANRELSL